MIATPYWSPRHERTRPAMRPKMKVKMSKQKSSRYHSPPSPPRPGTSRHALTRHRRRLQLHRHLAVCGLHTLAAKRALQSNDLAASGDEEQNEDYDSYYRDYRGEIVGSHGWKDR